MSRQNALLLPFVAVALSGCMPLWLGAGVGAGYLAVQERGAVAAVTDMKVKTHVLDRLTQANYKFLAKIGVNVLEGDVLLTGVVPSDEDAHRVVSIVYGVPDVRQVYNEIQVVENYGVDVFTNDTWIGTQIRSRMVTTSDVYTINYTVEVVRGHVYVLGLARTPAEMERVLYLVRTTKGVRMVHNYIRVAHPALQQPVNVVRKQPVPEAD
ncbi:MAG: BON domain-containing protein [Proteobacteria bacterium]|nr:BON domain-containing protein [Pseudomonadota bacterium]